MRTSLRCSDYDRIPQANIIHSCAIYRDLPQQSTPETPESPDLPASAPRYAGLGVLEDITQAFSTHGPRGRRQGSLAPTLHRSVLPLIRWLRKNPCYGSRTLGRGQGRYGQMPRAKLHALMAAAGIARSTRYDHLAHLRAQGILRDLPGGMVELPGFNDPDTWAHHAAMQRKKAACQRRSRGGTTPHPRAQKVRDSDSAPNRTPQNPSFSAKFSMWRQSSSIGLRLSKAAAAYRRTTRLWGNGRGTRVRQAAAHIDHTDPAWLATLDAIAAAPAAAPLEEIFTKTQQPAQRAAQGPILVPQPAVAPPPPQPIPTQVVATVALEGASAPVGPVKKLPKIHTADPAVMRHTAAFTAMFPSHVKPVTDDELLADEPVTQVPPPARASKKPPDAARLKARDVLELNREHRLKLCWTKLKHLNLTYDALLAGVYNAKVIAPGGHRETLEGRVVHSAKQGWGMRLWRNS